MTFEIRRDRWGIPHISASSELALAYAQGYNAGTDRAWQLEVERHRSQGSSASILGAAHVEWDRFARRAKIEDTAHRCYRELNPETRAWVRRYVEGVNAGLRESDAPEFAALGIRPGKWPQWMPISLWLSGNLLMGSFTGKLWREEVARHLGEDFIKHLSTEGVWRAESNGWYVAGARTASGQALLGGDPHRAVELPGFYQQVHLRCDEYDVVGFAVPGIPGIPHFLHTGGVAMSITNAMADAQDLYYERIERTAHGIIAQGPEGPEPVEAISEIIEVLDGDDEEIELLETRRGPVVVDQPDNGRYISLRTTSQALARSGFEALPRLLRARTVDDIDAALDAWVEPVNVVLAADTQGGSLSRTAGLIPQRHARNRLRIARAWQASDQWQGMHEPARGVTGEVNVMANERGLAAAFGSEFAPPHRARRLQALLKNKANWTAEAMAALHTDTHSGSARTLLTVMAGLSRDSEAIAAVTDVLSDWDCHMAGDSREAARFAQLRAAIVNRLAEHPLIRRFAERIDPAADYVPFFAPWLNVTTRLGFALETILTQGIPGIELAPLLHQAAQTVLDSLEPEATWDELHRVTPWQADPQGNSTDWPGIGGDHDCVLASYSLPGVTHNCWRAPIARYVWDLADRQNSSWLVQFGAAGNANSPHHADQYPLWREGRLIPVITDSALLHLESRGARPAADETLFRVATRSWGEFTFTQVDPDQHLDMLHQWLTAERARFWGMTNHQRVHIQDVFEYLDAQSTHNCYLIHLNDAPVALLQTYDPREDLIGEAYAYREGDIAVHLFIAPRNTAATGRASIVIVNAIQAFLFSNPANQRIVGEPDTDNRNFLRMVPHYGFTIGESVQLPHKNATLIYLERPQSERQSGITERTTSPPTS